jgi:hypothetical protein
VNMQARIGEGEREVQIATAVLGVAVNNDHVGAGGDTLRRPGAAEVGLGHVGGFHSMGLMGLMGADVFYFV